MTHTCRVVVAAMFLLGGGALFAAERPLIGVTTNAVDVLPNTQLASILGRGRLDVYSNHHQAVKRPGRGLRIAARSDDEVIEATEFADGRWGLLLQWHPARMEQSHRLKIFGALVVAAGPKSTNPSKSPNEP